LLDISYHEAESLTYHIYASLVDKGLNGILYSSTIMQPIVQLQRVKVDWGTYQHKDDVQFGEKHLLLLQGEEKIHTYIYTQLQPKPLLVSRGMLKMSNVSYRIFLLQGKQLIIG